MALQSSTTQAAPAMVALTSFTNMFSVGTVYALSALQAELPRLLDISYPLSSVPFASACLGLSVGAATCASLMASIGARATAAAGTSLWGLAVVGTGIFLAQTNFVGLLASLAVGGVGVGWTYLAIVVLVGQAFPPRSRLRSAIGPLGFSSGSAACFALSSFLELESLDAGPFGQLLQRGGAAFILVGMATQIMLPYDVETRKADNSQNIQVKPNTMGFEDALLFFNALPGMVAFSTLCRTASYHGQEIAGRALPYCMVALALGGFMASGLAAQPRSTFLTLFYVRGVSLLAFSKSPGLLMAVITLSLVLFGHGAGFGILPGLIKAKEPEPAKFRARYGRTLVAWGAAGIVSVLITGTLVSPSGDGVSASFVAGLIALSFAVYLQSANVL